MHMTPKARLGFVDCFPRLPMLCDFLDHEDVIFYIEAHMLAFALENGLGNCHYRVSISHWGFVPLGWTE